MYKTSTGTKSLCIRFDKIDGFVIILDSKIKHLILFDYGLLNEISDKIKYLIIKKGGTANSINHNFGKIKMKLYNPLLIKKTNFSQCYNKSAVKKNKNKYDYNIFLEKGS